ncbi:hypothetical protein ES703_52421 [subsurface metagenome]
MKAKIVSITDLKKTVAEREAEQLLTQVVNSEGKAIEVTLESAETPRKINRIFRKAAESLGRTITARTREGRVIIRLKE